MVVIHTYIHSVGNISINQLFLKSLQTSSIFCPDPITEKKIIDAIKKIKEKKDSLGGIVECMICNLPIGIGDPIYEKLEAKLANGMMSLPASKGFEVGSGFKAAKMKGSEHNDLFTLNSEGNITTETNHCGGLSGGISNGQPLVFRVAFKPTSSIERTQKTVSVKGAKQVLSLPKNSRHDPCVALRAVPVIEAMSACVIADSMLYNRAINTSSNTHQLK